MQLQQAKKPITVISQVCGLAPFFWGKLGDLSVPLSLLLLAFCFGSNVIFLTDFWVSPKHTLPMYVFLFSVTGITLTHVLHRIAYLLKRLYLAGLISRLQSIQMSLGNDWEYRSAYWCSAGLLLGNGFIVGCYSFLRWRASQKGVFTMCNFMSSFTVYLVELQFVGIVHVLLQLFKQVNMAVTSNRLDVRYLMQVHAQLCDAAQEISSEFVLPVIVNLIFSFAALVTSLYFCLLGLLQGESASSDIRVLSYISWYWPLFGIPNLWLKFRCCHLAANQANHTAVLVHRRLLDEQETQVRYELEMFSIQLLHRRLRFTAGGFVTLDLTLLHSIVGAVTTYLIILIQFQFLL